MDFSQHLLLSIAQNLQNSYPKYHFDDHLKILQQSNYLLLQKNLSLEKELEELKQWKKSFLRDQTQPENTSQGISDAQKPKKRKYRPRRTYLEKNFTCQYSNCNCKYSSRIALNSHLRKKHGVKTYEK